MTHDRLFVDVRPPADVLDVLAALPRPAEPGVRWVPPHQWHVTLRFLGRAELGEVLDALRGVPLPPATAVLGPVVSRLGRSVVVVPVAGLDELALVVREATAGLGEPPDPRGFTGHLTLARLKDRGACGVAGSPVSASFAVGEVELVSSTVRDSGAAHEVLARFPVG